MELGLTEGSLRCGFVGDMGTRVTTVEVAADGSSGGWRYGEKAVEFRRRSREQRRRLMKGTAVRLVAGGL